MTFDVAPVNKGEAKRLHQEPLSPVEQNQFNAWLAECDRVANLWEGPFDSAADLRRLRDEEYPMLERYIDAS